MTGAYGGLGLEMALSMCEAGAFVYAIDVPKLPSKDFEAASEAAKRFGTQLVYVHGDATDPAGLAVIFKAIQAKHHRLDVLVAAAAILGESLCSSTSGPFPHADDLSVRRRRHSLYRVPGRRMATGDRVSQRTRRAETYH